MVKRQCNQRSNHEPPNTRRRLRRRCHLRRHVPGDVRMTVEQALATVRAHWRDDLPPSEALAIARKVLVDSLNHSGHMMTALRYNEIERWFDVATRELKGRTDA